MNSENWLGWVYEHIYFAELMLGRSLRENEIIHHIDCNPSNNRYENLLVIERSQHTKMHAWIDRGCPIYTPYKDAHVIVESSERILKQCDICELMLQEKQEIYCSKECEYLGRRVVDRPSKDMLQSLIENNSWVALGKMYKVSDNAVRKWAKGYGLLSKG